MSNHFVQVCFINIKWNQLCDTMFFSKTRWYFDSPLQCPLPRGDNRWLLHPRVSDWLWWLLYWLMRFFFFFFLFHFFSRAFWVEWSLLLLLSSTWQCFKVFPQIPNVHSNSLHTIYPEGQSPRSWYIGASLSSAGDVDWRGWINVDHKHCG